MSRTLVMDHGAPLGPTDPAETEAIKSWQERQNELLVHVFKKDHGARHRAIEAKRKKLEKEHPGDVLAVTRGLIAWADAQLPKAKN